MRIVLPKELQKYVDPIAPHCFVYFISEGENTKIGFAKDMNKRLAGLQIGNPRKLRIVSFVPCATERFGREIERFLHSVFSYCRKNGEWFGLPGCAFTHQYLDFVVDYEDWRMAKYEVERRKAHKRKHICV